MRRREATLGTTARQALLPGDNEQRTRARDDQVQERIRRSQEGGERSGESGQEK